MLWNFIWKRDYQAKYYFSFQIFNTLRGISNYNAIFRNKIFSLISSGKKLYETPIAYL